MKRRVFVTSCGMVSSVGGTAETSWQALVNGVSGQRVVTRFDASRYEHAPVCSVEIVPEPLQRRWTYPLDDASKILLGAATEAIGGRTDLEEAPLYLAATLGGMDNGTKFFRDQLEHGITAANRRLLTDYIPFMQGQHLRECFGFKRAPLVISSACSSGGNALGLAWLAVSGGHAENAVVGGYDIISEFAFGGFNSLRLVSPTVCRPFDKARQGLVLGEAAAVLIVESEESAARAGRQALAELSGYAGSCEAYHVTQPRPDGSGAAAVIRKALESAEIRAEDVDCVNAHATGTLHNDVMEARAIAEVFKDNARICITANKAAVGHTLGAAGVVEGLFSVLSLRDQVVPPTLNVTDGIDELGRVRLVTEKTDLPMRHVISTSFGFGGTNACVVFSRNSRS